MRSISGMTHGEFLKFFVAPLQTEARRQGELGREGSHLTLLDLQKAMADPSTRAAIYEMILAARLQTAHLV